QDKSSILRVPLIDYYLPVGYRDILFQKDSNGIILGAIQEIRPGKAYLAAKSRNGDEDMRQFVTNEDFTGDIIIFDPFDNVPLRGRRFKDGLVTGDLKYKSRALMVDDPIDPPKPKKKPTGLDDDGPAFEIGLPAVEITAPRPGTPSTPGTNIPFPSEPVLPKPGGPVTPNNPIPIGGGGRGTGAGNSLNLITNDTKDPCISQSIETALNSKLTNNITTIFNTFFSGSNEYNVTFNEDTFGNTIFAKTTALNQTNFEITLNIDLLKGAAKELIVATILHEMIHGIFDARSLGDASPTRLKWDEAFQHQMMAAGYINVMSAALTEIFPSLPKEDADALSWEGVQKTFTWKALVQSDPTKANDIALKGDQYEKGNKKGTRCP
ncbi:SprT-like domain-containing protein, partial [Chitinophaga polysaccharea]|uniref:SprT-like domain-containing protein n=1 Tax=Chitinophaga polysaccharea TaxID=1293035 RepID=UPI001C8E1A31